MIEIAMLAQPGTFVGSVAALLDGYSLARERRERVLRLDGRVEADMRLTILSPDGSPISLDGRGVLHVDGSPAGTDRFDLVWLPSFRSGGPTALSQRIAGIGPQLEWIGRQHATGAWVGASGSAIALVLAGGLAKRLAIPVAEALAPTMREVFPRVGQELRLPIVESDRLLLGRGLGADIGLVARAFDRLFSPATGHWLRAAMGQDISAWSETARDPIADTARLWLEQRFAENTSIAGLADELGIPHSSLSRRFKAEFGLTPVAFVGALRLAAAKRMLADSNRTIDSIAAAVGYNDARNFRSTFKRVEGLSARAWRFRQKSSAFCAESSANRHGFFGIMHSSGKPSVSGDLP